MVTSLEEKLKRRPVELYLKIVLVLYPSTFNEEIG